MKILSRYIVKELFYHFFIILGLFSIIILAKEMFDTREEILDQQPAFADVIGYVLCSIPQSIVMAIPLIAMFGALFGLGLMAKNREIIAMVSSGVSFFSLAIPVGIYGLGVTAFSFWLTEYLAPMAQDRAHFLYEVRIKGENQFAFMSNDEIFRKGAGTRFYIMGNYDNQHKVMTRPSILDKTEDGHGLAQRIEAKSGKIIASQDGKHQYWEFEGAQQWIFNPDGSVKTQKFDKPLRIEMEDNFDSFLGKEKSPEEMGLGELQDFVDILSRQGGNASLPKYQTAVQSKISIPFSCLLLTLIAFSLAADLRARHFILIFSVGLGFGVGFYMSREALMGMGRTGVLSQMVGSAGPYVAAWGPTALFGVLVLFLLRRLTTVH